MDVSQMLDFHKNNQADLTISAIPIPIEEASKFEEKYDKKHPPYQIPLRALISADIDNLLMAGRCISGDFVAHSSYRVAGPAFRTGEVAGAYAAYCVENNVLPNTLADLSSFL